MSKHAWSGLHNQKERRRQSLWLVVWTTHCMNTAVCSHRRPLTDRPTLLWTVHVTKLSKAHTARSELPWQWGSHHPTAVCYCPRFRPLSLLWAWFISWDRPDRFLAAVPRVIMIRTALRSLACTRLPFSTGNARPALWYRLAQTQQEQTPDEDNQLPPTIEELKKIDPSIGRVGKTWNYDLELSALAQRLGYKLSQLPSLQMALTHFSVVTNRPMVLGQRVEGSKRRQRRPHCR